MSDSKPTRNSKKQTSSRLISHYGEWREVERADEYPAEADGSQTISELCREYNHIVDDLKWWPYFDIRGCLERLHWSVDECYGRIGPLWTRNSLLTRHAVVQLALYTCPPFREIPPALYPRSSATDGYIVDESDRKSGDKNQRRYLCPDVASLVEALATALMHYEDWCELTNSWPHFQKRREICVRLLKDLLRLRNNASRRGFAPQDPVLWHNRRLPDDIHRVMAALQSFTYADYQNTNAPTNEPRDPRARGHKYNLLEEMQKAFRDSMPKTWSHEATCRALAAIMNQMAIKNAKRKEWKPLTIRQLLKRGPDPRLSFTIDLTRQTVVPWYTRPE